MDDSYLSEVEYEMKVYGVILALHNTEDDYHSILRTEVNVV